MLDYDARKKLFAQYEGKKVVITVARVDYLRQGSEVSKIPYTTKHSGKIKNAVFYETGKRRPFSFMTGELVDIKGK
jgi:hypothetical protein